jgi:hypothetical protein
MTATNTLDLFCSAMSSFSNDPLTQQGDAQCNILGDSDVICWTKLAQFWNDPVPVMNSTPEAYTEGEMAHTYVVTSRALPANTPIRVAADYSLETQIQSSPDVAAVGTWWTFLTADGPIQGGRHGFIDFSGSAETNLLGETAINHTLSIVAGAASKTTGNQFGNPDEIYGNWEGQAWASLKFKGFRALTSSNTPLDNVRFRRTWPPMVDAETVLVLGFTGEAGHTYQAQYSTNLLSWVNYGGSVQSSSGGPEQQVVSAAMGPAVTWRVVDVASPSQAIPVTQTRANEFSVATKSGNTYTWETSTNLVSWESHGASFAGSNSVAALTVTNDGSGFYRIKSTAP